MGGGDARTRGAGVGLMVESVSSNYIRDPDGSGLELIAEPLGTMYGEKVV